MAVGELRALIVPGATMFPFSLSLRDWSWALAVFAVGALFGAAIWWTSPVITGQAEPWHADGQYYFWALFVAGFAATCFLPRAFWLAPLGVVVGQLLYGWYLELLVNDLHGWLVTGIVVVYSGVALAGALTGAILSWILRLPVGVVRYLLKRSAEVDFRSHRDQLRR
jgi:hypothetical protein